MLSNGTAAALEPVWFARSGRPTPQPRPRDVIAGDTDAWSDDDEVELAPITPTRAPRWVRYGLACLFIAGALGLSLALQPLTSDRLMLFPFYVGIAAAAGLAGSGPGWLAVALSVPAGLYTEARHGSIDTLWLDAPLLFLAFVTCAGAGASVSSRERRAKLSLARAHRELQLRAAQMEDSNRALTTEMGERRRAEQALQKAHSELARVSRLTTIGELTASIAHEINQPLTAIVTNVGNCLRRLGPEHFDADKAREAAQRIARDAQRASEVIARIRAMVITKAPPSRSMINLNRLAGDVVGLLRIELEREQVEVKQSLTADIPQILGDRVQLQQVFLNLVMNAIEALSVGPHGSRVIELVSGCSDGDYAEIVITDNGPGLGPLNGDAVFEAFVTTKDNGMGLGLSICRSIVEAHGGTLSAANAPGRGAAFSLKLPRYGA